MWWRWGRVEQASSLVAYFFNPLIEVGNETVLVKVRLTVTFHKRHFRCPS